MYLFLFALEDELSQLELKIEELKLAARELKDRRNVRLFLPHEPLWPLVKRQENELDPNSSFMTLEDSIDFRFVSSRGNFFDCLF